ncbi:hypothetical protein M407DRAFT_244826 [Tulasnella calospora MUT 4182]|uniref:Uncharacterized protein n=1 Tax=Tulasnella calospora MUT 4182 TaxID=1051891 RepID=A0A0C3KPG3_9AGAM|nr:hypothetical protein M407DRAFT_244826 [Tulasnella calospora MUT 4182]
MSDTGDAGKLSNRKPLSRNPVSTQTDLCVLGLRKTTVAHFESFRLPVAHTISLCMCMRSVLNGVVA